MLINSGAATRVTGELFHTPAGAAFADLTIDGQRQTWAIRSKMFRAWLRRSHYKATGTSLDAGAIRSTLDLLGARALFDAAERPVFVRVAEQGGRIYLELADEHWRAVKIGPDGWRVIGSPPVRFRRPQACCRFQRLSEEVQSRRWTRLSTCQAETISSWSWPGCRPPSDLVGPIR